MDMRATAIALRGPRRTGRGAEWFLIRAATLWLIAVRVAIASLAEASLPDPVWIAGVYDDGDFDDIVDHLVSLASACDWAPTPTPSSAVSGTVVPCCAPRAVDTARIPPHGRAPPLS